MRCHVTVRLVLLLPRSSQGGKIHRHSIDEIIGRVGRVVQLGYLGCCFVSLTLSNLLPRVGHVGKVHLHELEPTIGQVGIVVQLGDVGSCYVGLGQGRKNTGIPS
jgi:hypothetical protein